VIALGDALTAARALLAASNGHTMTDRSRQALSEAIATTAGDLAVAVGHVGNLATASAKTGEFVDSARFAKLMTVELRDLEMLGRDMTSLSSTSGDVRTSQVARTRQLQSAVRRAVAGAYRENVWTSGFQAQIDACRGGVNVTAAYGVRVIGEEWGCGGSRFPRQGALVRLSGTMSGLYRVGAVVAVLDAYTADPGDIPRGYALLYQTCRNNNAHTETFTELIPLGS
jgi:hypothetical protein